MDIEALSRLYTCIRLCGFEGTVKHLFWANFGDIVC